MFQVLHSSAGAGKTHALVKHYLTHALRSEEPGAYRQVLALTFTNAAAAEMKERVMHYLEVLAAGPVTEDRYRDVLEHLCARTGSDADTMAQRAERVLSHMLHHWSDVVISTIDAFTRRVVQPFARDLQLDHELRMTTEQDHYQQLAVESLIGEAGVEPTLTGLLTEVCLQLLHEERGWDPEKPLRELSGELNKESAIQPLQQLGGLQPEAVMALVHHLREQERRFQEAVRGIGRRGLELIAGQGLQPGDFFQGSRGVPGYFSKLAAFEAEGLSPNSYVRKSVEEHKWTGGKADAAAKAAMDAVAPALEELILQAMALEADHKAFLLRRAVARELPTAYALHALDERLEAIKHADGVAFFSDLTRKVAQVVKHEPVPFIHERMGERYRHFLIDEFQDTSLLQWNALLPLIDNALGSGGSALLVGDAKQAIYRWRNGEVRLFTHFPKLFGRDPDDAAEAQRERNLEAHHRPVAALAGNHRSASTIVTFNNRVFGRLAELLPGELRNVYEGHAQEVVRDRPGLVDLWVMPRELTGDARREAMLEHLMRAVHEALEDGFRPGDIAVLVRGRSTGSTVSAHLVAQGFQVVSPDGLQLSGDPLVGLLVDLLRFLHTGEAAAAMRVLQAQAVLGSASEQHTVDPFAQQDGLLDACRTLRERLKAQGAPRLSTTLTALIDQLARAHGHRPGQDVQLLTLLDEAHAWSLRNGQDIGGFLEHWDRTGGQRSVAPPEHGGAIQVMTVHKSKGLQFPVVILPQTRMAGSGGKAEHLWVRPGAVIPELPVGLVRSSAALRAADVPEVLEEDELQLLDALNLTYVAFTRPQQRLYAGLHGADNDAVSEGLRTWIQEEGDGERLVLGARSEPWQARQGRAQEPLGDAGSGQAFGNVVLRLEAPEVWDPADPDPHRAFGNAVHHVLEQVRTAADLDAAMAQAVDLGLLSPEAAPELLQRLRALLTAPGMERWFGPDLEVRTEATLITPDGRALRPDRVVLNGDRVGVLDIKTGGPAPAHQEQVKAYMQRLSELGEGRVEGALLYVTAGRLEPVEP